MDKNIKVSEDSQDFSMWEWDISQNWAREVATTVVRQIIEQAGFCFTIRDNQATVVFHTFDMKLALEISLSKLMEQWTDCIKNDPDLGEDDEDEERGFREESLILLRDLEAAATKLRTALGD